MGYVFNEIFWWVLAALVIGFFLGWLFWKCRVWLSGADTGGRNAAELAALAESNEAEIASLRSELDGRATTVSELTGKLQLADSNGLELRSRITELEARAALVPGLQSEVAGMAAMRSRMNDLESDNAQIPRLNTRIQELEAVSSELPLIKSRVADLAEQNGQVPALEARIGELETENARIAEMQARIAELETENAESQALRTRVLELEDAATAAASMAAVPAALTALGSDDLAFESDSGNGDGSGHPQTLLDLAPAAITDDESNGDQPEPGLDLAAAGAVLGMRIRKDDLTVVEGIGPKISDIIRSDGVTTWRSLSLTSPGHLKELLDAAGPRFQMHDPGTWPEQAGLLADGRWEDFAALTAELDGGVRRTGDRPVGFMSEPPTIDLDFEAAADVLGFTPVIDDLKVVEGIGPAIERLLNDAGIDTWLALAGTDPAAITSILEEAGPRFRIHDPGTWPTQATMLSEGRWEDFKVLTDQLKGGRV